jgi:hypothetical protein
MAETVKQQEEEQIRGTSSSGAHLGVSLCFWGAFNIDILLCGVALCIHDQSESWQGDERWHLLVRSPQAAVRSSGSSSTSSSSYLSYLL